ncbi:hypothetical protein PT974_09711 [Cladobotryum mycophilum]|uniref:Uncharacterized protein n=1 Tax=Cladobotryum mycophilum TaxID=491253 RepID=A0ABR0SHE7_9HYPO
MAKQDNFVFSTGRGIAKAAKFVWHWSVPYKSGHRPDDIPYAAVWNTPIDEESILDTLQAVFPDIPRNKLPTEEEHIRQLVRHRLQPYLQSSDEESAPTLEESANNTAQQEAQRKLLEDTTEEAWQHVPLNLRHLLAALNAHHVDKKLDELIKDNYHTKSGLGGLTRAKNGVSKTFKMWRLGFRAAVSRFERYSVNFFFLFLAFSACYPDVAAGFLGERSYNQRSIGSRIVTLCQLFHLRTFDFPSFWLLFNWSLERLLGAFVGNTVYALTACIPALHVVYRETWFRTMMLVLSMSWQVSVQFTPPLRDYIVRLVTRRQMTGLRNDSKAGHIDWGNADKIIESELKTLKTYTAQQAQKEIPPSWQEVPIRVRIERYIQFTGRFVLGRPADQLVGLLKEDLEGVINTYEDYSLTKPRSSEEKANRDKGHVEPRAPKFLLVAFDICIFAYVCYSFFPQPFTFNTVVAYGTVVIIKQAIVAIKRYQTLKSARRLFTNMVSINILGVFLVSTPVTVDRHVLAKTGNFIALTLAMVFATLFLAEPIAPLMLSLTEKITSGSSALINKLRSSKKSENDLPGSPQSERTEVASDEEKSTPKEESKPLPKSRE